ncbi:type II toxin-antitoxin system VapC family toxin [Prosthecobacter dejongeii]|uniref:tRNA(fMet)-specific endonuclease VapC n=1 Tax=Prosthecobacter dejongeii TaxID=48465 RepID=A0A7W8DRU4_9BACT|nr:type II toxin-antitoxin system VapC family toxin [Prosthecobacter dejongeii]MBB5040264.1 tRNA(fMet)-specific endonuclease VapC [Prosthecobacter dejongeii]
MLVLDTNHITALGYSGDLGDRLRNRLFAANQETATTIVNVEEQLRGWMAVINRLQDPHEQIAAYSELNNRIDLFASWIVLPWDAESAEVYLRMKAQRIRIGTMDLKIASIAIVHDAVLLTRNTGDFAQVPGLRFENWLDE